MQYTINKSGWFGGSGSIKMGSRLVQTPDGDDRHPIRMVKQVHGATILNDRTFEHPRQEADGLTTSLLNLELIIMTADCVPVYLYNDERIALIHAGWRGAKQGIVQNGLEYFPDKAQLHAVIGPSISMDHYEVDQDLYADWANQDKRLESFLRLTSPESTKRMFDLKGLIAAILLDSGVQEPNLTTIPICTYASPLPSYRRDGKQAGRIYNYIHRVAH